MSLRGIVTTAALLLCCALPAAAQGVKLEFHDGRVNISAQNVPLRTILNEWARLGGTKIVNAERVPGGLVTIELNGVPERQALDVLLRSASGYLAGPRQPGAGGPSAFASILILPTSSAPRPSVAPPPPQPFPVAGQFPQVAPPPDPDDDPAGDVPPEDDPEDREPPRPGARPRVIPPRVNGQPQLPQPFEPEDRGDNGEGAPAAVQPPAANPGNPFGVPAGSSRPGVITPVPQQQPQRTQPDPEP